jgi:alkyldihydroxyacetonephosphate synthase
VTEPTPVTPIDATGADVADRLGARVVEVPPALLERLNASGAEVVETDDARAEAGRDWWPIAIGWAAEGAVPQRPAVVVRPTSTEQVSAVLAACNEATVPVTAAAGRSGVCGGSIPVHGGVALDMTALDGLRTVDETSLRADVRAGTFGPDLETALGEVGTGYTLGHWPQSMDLSTVGGWLACRGAGQYSTRYGKIEDMVVGLEVVLADGRVVHTEGKGPRAATGPNLTQLFVGSEGTLGVITEARLRIHPLPVAQERRAFGFSTFAEGLEACRRILRRGATPAVLRLYDQTESERNFDEGETNVLIVLDEADLDILGGTMRIVDSECSAEAGAQPLDRGLVDRWLDHRNDVSALAPLWRAGIVVDTAEISGPWSALSGLFDDVIGALKAIDGTLAASAHQSHAYPDGACLYFTFGGRGPEGDDQWREHYYRQAWDTVTEATLAHGAAISHHHGIGLNRSRFLPRALGTGFEVLRGLKATFDPNGILNPGKFGLDSPFGPAPWA